MSCYLTPDSNLHKLSELALTRLSIRGCGSNLGSLLYMNGFTDLLTSVISLDVSCANISKYSHPIISYLLLHCQLTQFLGLFGSNQWCWQQRAQLPHSSQSRLTTLLCMYSRQGGQLLYMDILLVHHKY